MVSRFEKKLIQPILSKEHGADADCTNPYIPDTGNWIYRGEVNSKQDISFSEYRKNLVFDLGTSPQGNELLSRIYPKPGYQNAPAFCLNQKTMTTGD